MSGYGGQPPSSWQDPHGQNPHGQDPYGQDPYGRQPYGQNPYGQGPYAPYGQDPYAQDPFGPQPSWQDPYAQQYAQGQFQGQQGQFQGQGPQDVYGGPYGPPGIPQQPPPSNAAAVAAIIGNCVGLVFVCGIGIAWLPGLILGGIAVNKVRSDPAAARALTRYSWICCGLNFLIEAVIFIMSYVVST
jgi:hypothetical protein